MKTKLMVLGSSVLILTACVMVPRRGGGVQIIPILPVLVELDVNEPYYTQDGYYYYYSENRWNYATSRRGPWTELPRSHWPHETRWRGRDRTREYDRGPERRD